MENSGITATTRDMTLDDLDVILSIDHNIRAKTRVITYANLPTERIFTINRHVGRQARPTSYVDLISGNISELLDLGIVAEVDGHVRGFVLGKIAHTGSTGTPEGIILILGVHPDYWRNGIATRLVDEMCAKFHRKGIKQVRIEVDQRDKPMLGFVEQEGFNAGHLIDYAKAV